jgi:iron uptake system component EfeO
MNVRSARAAVLALLAGCGADAPLTDADRQRAVLLAVKSSVAADLGELVTASRALRDAAPAPDADGWSAAADASAVTAMRTHWLRARRAYERIEGAIAVLFPEIDVSIDQRYDAFLTDEIPSHRDDDLFDGQGVTGMHAVERILWAGTHPARVVAFERGLTGYVAAAFPSDLAQSTRFRDGLVARLVRDAEQMQREFAPLALDTPAAFRGVIGSVQEQVEKVERAATAEEESRYAQVTLLDMRANLEGAQRTWNHFRAWTLARGGDALAARIDARFAALQSAYGAIRGDALPAVPEGWNPDAPSATQLATPYGQLRTTLARESDPARAGSLATEMNAAADLLAIPRL